MKKVGLIVALAMVGMLAARSASAAMVYVDRIPGYYSGSGGEFTMSQTGLNIDYDALATYTYADDTVGFQTFCLEKNENIPTPRTYDYTIEYYAIAGGVGGSDPIIGGDPLSWGTTWLYSQFADGALTGYDYNVGTERQASARLLQDAIWWLEEEQTSYIAGNIFVLAAIAQFGSEDDARADATAGAYGVWAINPTSNDGDTLRQSMLVRIRVPDGGATVAMLGLALLGCFGLQHRLRQ